MRPDDDADVLDEFSVDDLRRYAAYRKVRVANLENASRETLLRAAKAVFSNFSCVEFALRRMNQGSLAVLAALLFVRGVSGRREIERLAGAGAAAVVPRLEQLRVAGLVLPRGDWDHIVIPSIARRVAGWSLGTRRQLTHLPDVLMPPSLRTVEPPHRHTRPGSFSRDLAELLGMVARSTWKLTQSGTIHRRNLTACLPLMSLPSDPYLTSVAQFAVVMRYIVARGDEAVTVGPAAPSHLSLPLMRQLAGLRNAWLTANSFDDPVESQFSDEVDGVWIRQWFFEALPPDGAMQALDSLADLLDWTFPLMMSRAVVRGFSGHVVEIMARSLWQLGLVDLDEPGSPASVGYSAAGRALLDGKPDLPDWERQFILQPNGEAFMPPNLLPLNRMQLRRLSAEKKGAPEGMVQITKSSIAEALARGLRPEDILEFLRTNSRTGLPPTVEDLVRTAGRQHGRIRIFRTEYVVVTESPELMQELRSLKTVADNLDGEVANVVARVSEEHLPGLLRNLRQRGYTPSDETSDLPAIPLISPKPK